MTDQEQRAAPDATNPAPDAANPAPDATNPAPDATNPAPDAANPAPDAANPAPDAANPAPDVTGSRPPRSPRASQGETPLYKGEPLDSERGPGLGCFWIQAITLGILLVLTPITVALAWPPLVSAALLIITLILLLFTGQTVIFLLRLVAADRRGRRTPRSASARKTVGMLEDESAEPERPDVPADPEVPADREQPPTTDVPPTTDDRD